jgi:hypothetical protein
MEEHTYTAERTVPTFVLRGGTSPLAQTQWSYWSATTSISTSAASLGSVAWTVVRAGGAAPVKKVA